MAQNSKDKALNFARIVYHLMLDPRGWNVDALCAQFSITKRTYRNYLSELKGLPEFMDSQGDSMLEDVGRGETRTLRLRRDLPESGASQAGFRSRLVAMHMARKMFGYLEGTSVGEEIGLLLDRFEESFRDVVAIEHAMRHADRKLHVIEGASKDYDAHRDTIAALVDATLRQRMCHGVYVPSWSGEQRDIKLEPLSLVSSRGALYLLARAHDSGEEAAVLTYSIDRFRALQVSETQFDYPSAQAFDPERFFEGEFGLYQRHDGAKLIRVELLFSAIKWLHAFLQERDWHPTQRFETREDGRLAMSFSVSTMGSVWPWIRSFGDDVEVVCPAGPVPMTSDEARTWRKARKDEL
jgi:predicted DNA-binding transcriptional regulator YafY